MIRLLVSRSQFRAMRLAQQLSLFGVVPVRAHLRHQDGRLVQVQEHTRHVDSNSPPHYDQNVGGRGAAPAEVSMSEKTETRLWRKATDGYRVGQTVRMGGATAPWRTIVRAGKAKTRRLTAMDEDMGNGQQGDTQTSQEVTHREATADEIAAAEAKVEAAAEAKRQADPRHRSETWVKATGAVRHSDSSVRGREIAGMALPWATVASSPHNGPSWAEATGPDGRKYGRYTSGFDDYRTIYYEVMPADEAAAAAAAELASTRARVFAAVRKFGHATALGWGREYAHAAEPQTADEHAAVAEGKVVDAQRATIRAHLAALESSGIVTPADTAAVRAHFDVEEPAEPGRSQLTRWSTHADDLKAGPTAAQRIRQTDTDPTATYDLALTAALDRVDRQKAPYATKAYDAMLPKFGEFGRGFSTPEGTWDYLDRLAELATSRGTYATVADRIGAERAKVIQAATQFVNTKKARQTLAEQAAAPDAHPVRMAAWSVIATPDIAGALPKKVQAALQAKGLLPE